MKRIPTHCTALGTLSYNKAALVLKNAAPLANSDKAKYDAQKEIADKTSRMLNVSGACTPLTLGRQTS